MSLGRRLQTLQRAQAITTPAAFHGSTSARVITTEVWTIGGPVKPRQAVKIVTQINQLRMDTTFPANAK